jgi:hypothetical protein
VQLSTLLVNTKSKEIIQSGLTIPWSIIKTWDGLVGCRQITGLASRR